MQLTGKEIIERGLVTGYCEEGVQQQGVDVRLDRVLRFDTNPVEYGIVPTKGKTKLRPRIEIEPKPFHDYGTGWYLNPGYYEVITIEGCDMPKDAAMYLRTRSSLVRNGAIVHSGQFDAGFNTDHMGFFLEVNFPIFIEKGARIAQTIFTSSADVENLYDGQFMRDCQRG